MRFAASWDNALKVTTAVNTLILLAVLGSLGVFVVREGAPQAAAVLVAALFPAIVGSTWAFAPRSFSIEGGRLVIERPLFAIDVPLSGVRAVGSLPDGSFRGSLKVAGSAGMFGYYGRFWSRGLGAFRLYATRKTGLVVVDTAGERFVLSPEPADRFVDALRQHAPAASGAPAGAPTPRPMPRRVRVRIVLAAASLPLVFGGVVLANRAIAPRAVVIEHGEIRVERAHAPPVVVPLSDVRRVERLAPDRARFERVTGTATEEGVRYGHFRSPELGDVRLYAWRPGPYVLLETAGERIVVTPDDPDAFVAAVRAGPRP